MIATAATVATAEEPATAVRLLSVTEPAEPAAVLAKAARAARSLAWVVRNSWAHATWAHVPTIPTSAMDQTISSTLRRLAYAQRTFVVSSAQRPARAWARMTLPAYLAWLRR